VEDCCIWKSVTRSKHPESKTELPNIATVRSIIVVFDCCFDCRYVWSELLYPGSDAYFIIMEMYTQYDCTWYMKQMFYS
jgi:hypothetical protein